jgi:large repetitive protein
VLANDTDLDTTDTHTVSEVEGSAGNVGEDVDGTYGTLHLNANGSYTYTLHDGLLLADGAVVQDEFHYTNRDSHGATSSSTLTITITGSENNVPVIGGADTGEVVEDAGEQLATSGVLTISDPDGPVQSKFQPQISTAGNHGYGQFTLDADGHWTYGADNSQTAIQRLGAGDTLTDGFTAVSFDGTASHTVTVTIRGTNDVPEIGGVSTANVTEDASTPDLTAAAR